MTSKIPLRKLTPNNSPSRKGKTRQIVLKNWQIIPDPKRIRVVPVPVKKRQAKPNIEIEVKNPSSPAPIVQEKQVETVAVATHVATVTEQANRAIALKENTPCGPTQKSDPGSIVLPDNDRPWLIKNSKDPEPAQHWYTPARFFARMLVLDDPTLLTKKDLLTEKVSISLKNSGIFKRGGKLPPAATTIKKAFVNITFN